MFKEINLEMSLKVFKETTPEYIEKTVRQVYDQWSAMLKNRKSISILIWASDGSDILDYTGDLDKEIEWAYLIGTAKNPTVDKYENPDVYLHQYNVKYIDNPPVMTYKILKNIVAAIKKEGKKRYPDTNISVGIPFDIGPEFAKSDFKYNRHTEICQGSGEGIKTFIESYALLDADDYPYAGFPDGIPQDTPFGKFLGRQSKYYMRDLDFDYMWLSNGVGFAANSWSATGPVFDGEEFDADNFDAVLEKVFSFWKYFREECPDYPIYTRGTNFSAGVDYAVHGVALHKIYNSGLNIIPPPNSPWAAINDNYGLELMGHLTRNCELPGEDFMFRFYLHDPWWDNSPWYDRYNMSPHDIYLPMSLSRIDESGKTKGASIMNILSIDNSFGEMPDNCVYETIPHFMQAEKDSADAPSAFVWVYPFREYTTLKDEARLKQILTGDYFISRCMMNGLPLTTVVSCDNFINHNKDIYKKSVLVTPIPIEGSEFEKEIFKYIENGGRVLFYGALDNASDAFTGKFDITLENVDANISLDADVYPDTNRNGINPCEIIIHKGVSSGMANSAKNGGFNRLTAKYKNAVWYFAPLELESLNYDTHQRRDIENPAEAMWGSVLMRKVIEDFGYKIQFSKPVPQTKLPIIMINKHDNADIFSVFSPDQTVETKLKFPLGAPVLDQHEVEIKDGCAVYRFSKCFHKECRVYVEQEDGVVGVKEKSPVSMKYHRRIKVFGLKNATVRFFPEKHCEETTDAILNAYPDAYEFVEDFDGNIVHSEEYGTYYEVRNVTGHITFSMPPKNKK